MSDSSARIMIVDDDQLTMMVLDDILRPHFQILKASNGKEALALAESESPPDLILMDIVMPEVDGYEACRRLKSNPDTRHIPVIFVTGQGEDEEQAVGFQLGGVDYIRKPAQPAILLARVRAQLALFDQSRALELQIQKRTSELQSAQEALRDAMGDLLPVQAAPGVMWLKIPEAGLKILCGCPGEVVKTLMRKGFVTTVTQDDVTFETGPNVILLSDQLVQNGAFANLAEFPVLHMLYRQGMIIPGHPNNSGQRPMIMGAADQVNSQMDYIHRGNYGLLTKEEILATGVDEETADIMMRIKLKFAFGEIRSPATFIDTLEVVDQPREIRNGALVQRIGRNRFRFIFREHSAEVDLNLGTNETYELPYPMGFHRFKRYYFAVLHTGEGDGWDVNRPCMSSIVMFQGRIFLVDTPPNTMQNLTALGIDISEVEGIFHTHAHDDHFAGLPALIHTGRRLKYFATPLVRASVERKFEALMSMEPGAFERFFDTVDLAFDKWNNYQGLEVMPLFSPHPVETNLYMFRAMDGGGYRTYAHWADLSSFKVLDAMTGDGPDEVPEKFMEKVKRDYLRLADVKKLDIGGGMIHGVADDFRQDPSKRLIMAHIARKMTTDEMKIGSESAFGALDILIASDQNYFRQRAYHFLSTLFKGTPHNQLQMLVNCQVELFNAGTIIHRSGRSCHQVDMILSGTVAYLEEESDLLRHFGFGSFLDLNPLLTHTPRYSGTCRAVSHCSVLRIPTRLFQSFLNDNGLLENMRVIFERIQFLRHTWLFSEKVAEDSMIRIAQNMTLGMATRGSVFGTDAAPEMRLLRKGCVQISNGQGASLGLVGEGDFFGTRLSLGIDQGDVRHLAMEDLEFFTLDIHELMKIPIVYWKMLEKAKERS
ncbi:MAG: response regulator [Magnetococcales bacterium]|nr:response regulator [Magnetococcales bacterium]